MIPRYGSVSYFIMKTNDNPEGVGGFGGLIDFLVDFLLFTF